VSASDAARHAGRTAAWALELEPLPCLSAGLTAGCKVAIRHPAVQRGALLLTAGSVDVLGGGVPALEAARRRLLAHWNQPLGCSLLTVQVRCSLAARLCYLAAGPPS
jgi:RecQ mediated genome instability protein